MSAGARFVALAVVWGTSFLFIKVGLHGLSPVQIVLARLVAGTAVLAIVLLVRRQRLPRDRRLWGHLALMGLLANAAPFYLFAYGEQRASSSLAGIYNASTPLLTLLVAIAVLPDERPSRRRVGGLLLGFVGVAVLVAPWRGVGVASTAGQTAFLGAAALYGATYVYMRRFVSGRADPAVLSAVQLGCASLILLVLAPGIAWQPVTLSADVVLAVLALGVLGTGLAYVVNYQLIRELGATRAASVTYLIPLVAVVLGVTVLGESVGWHDFVGGAVVLLGVAVAHGVTDPPGGGRDRAAKPAQRWA